MNEHQGSVEPTPEPIETDPLPISTLQMLSEYAATNVLERSMARELLTLRTQPTAEQVRDQAYADVLEILKAEKALAWPERSNFHVAQRIDFINRLKLEVQIRRDSASAKAGGGL